MKSKIRWVLALLAMLVGSLTAVTAPAAQATPNEHANERAFARAACPPPTAQAASCTLQYAAKGGNSGGGSGGGSGSAPVTSTTPIGYGPDQFHGAYNIPTHAANPVTIAIVVAYDNPNAKADLDIYNDTFNLPYFPSCSTTVTTACFEKVKQRSKMSVNEVWALESSLDVQTAHQMCQNCKILLVETVSNSFSSLMWGVDKAVSMGAKIVNSSFAALEQSGHAGAFDSYYNHPGVAFTAATGDWGYGVYYPAASQYVTAVGGTTLQVGPDNTRVSETVWDKTGSGCSAYSPKPAFQTATAECSKRTVADVAADADPNTGAAIYSSIGYGGETGWFRLGGTSLAAPLIAGVYAHGGLVPGVHQNSLPYTKRDGTNLYDVTSGSNSTCGTYLCQGTIGYDGPTGLGSPIGASAF